MCVRAFTQDDAHIFCTEEQITEECCTVCQLILDIYRILGSPTFALSFSDRPAKRIGSDEIWDKSEAALIAAVKTTGLVCVTNPGEGAFQVLNLSLFCVMLLVVIGSAALCKLTLTSQTVSVRHT